MKNKTFLKKENTITTKYGVKSLKKRTLVPQLSFCKYFVFTE